MGVLCVDSHLSGQSKNHPKEEKDKGGDHNVSSFWCYGLFQHFKRIHVFLLMQMWCIDTIPPPLTIGNWFVRLDQPCDQEEYVENKKGLLPRKSNQWLINRRVEGRKKGKKSFVGQDRFESYRETYRRSGVCVCRAARHQQFSWRLYQQLEEYLYLLHQLQRDR